MALTNDRRSALDALAYIPRPMIRERGPVTGTLVNVLADRPPTGALEKALSTVGVNLQDDLIRAIREGLSVGSPPAPSPSRPVEAEALETAGRMTAPIGEEETSELDAGPERDAWQEWDDAPLPEAAMARFESALFEPEPEPAPYVEFQEFIREPERLVLEPEATPVADALPPPVMEARSPAIRFEAMPAQEIRAALFAEIRHLTIRYEPVDTQIVPAPTEETESLPDIVALAPAEIEPVPAIELTPAVIFPEPSFPGASRDDKSRQAPSARALARRIRAKALRDSEEGAKRLARLATARTRKSIREEGVERLEALEKALRSLHLDHTMVTYKGRERMIVSWWMAAEFVKRESKLSLMKLARFRAEDMRGAPALPAIEETDPVKRSLKQKEWARAGLKKVRYLEREGGPWHRFSTIASTMEADAALDG